MEWLSMKRFSLYLIIALLTFTVGFAATMIMRPLRRTAATERTARLALKTQSTAPSCGSESVRRLKEASRADAADANLRHLLGEAYRDLGCYEEASRAYQEAITIAPSDSQPYGDLANTYDHLGRYEEAIEVLKKGLRLDPEDAFSQSELGFAYNALGQYRPALKAFRRALQLDPGDAYAHATVSDTYLHLGRYREAAAEARQAISLSTVADDDAALCNAAWTLFSLNRLEETIGALQKALHLSPDNIFTHCELGRVYAVTGREEEAAASFRKAIARAPVAPDEYLERGWAFLYLGDEDAAASEARSYLHRTGWKGHEAPRAGLLAHLAYRRAHREPEARDLITEAAANGDPSFWPQKIISYLRHQMTAAELLAQASSEEEMTEAQAYLGLNLSLEGHLSEARTYLTWVRDHGSREFSGYVVVLKELKQLQN